MLSPCSFLLNKCCNVLHIKIEGTIPCLWGTILRTNLLIDLQFIFMRPVAVTVSLVMPVWLCVSGNCSGFCIFTHQFWHFEIYSLGSRGGNSRPADMHKQENDAECPSDESHPTKGRGKEMGSKSAWHRRRDRRKQEDERQSRRMQTSKQRWFVLSLLLRWLSKGTGVERGDVNILRALHPGPWRGSYSPPWSLRARAPVSWCLSTSIVCTWTCPPVQWGLLWLKRKQPLLPMGRKWFSHFSNADRFPFSHQMKFPRNLWGLLYLNPKTAKSNLTKLSPEEHTTRIAAPLHPGALSHPAILLFAWPSVISYFSEKSPIFVILTRSSKSSSEARIKLFLLNQTVFHFRENQDHRNNF